MTLNELCSGLQLPVTVKDKVINYDGEISYDDLQEIVDRLLVRVTWDQAIEELKEALGEDADGMKMLTVMLKCALHTYEQYREKGIDEKVYWDTMRFCTRFIEAHKEIHGEYAFTWGWWFPRQLSVNEFRIGALEYELVEDKERKISVHIPADASLEPEQVKASINDFRQFLVKYYPQWCDVDLYCESWMLSPVLDKLLDENSRILQFQRLFEVQKVDYESMAVLDWVYPGAEADYGQLPEDTSLQRNMKRFLLEGGKVGWAAGKLRKEL